MVHTTQHQVVLQLLKQTVTRLTLFLFPQHTTAQEEKTSVLQNTMLEIQTVRLLQALLKLLIQEEQHVLLMNVAGREERQTLAQQAEVGADIQQATAVAQELCAHGMQQTHLAKLGHHQEQVQGIGDYPHKMR